MVLLERLLTREVWVWHMSMESRGVEVRIIRRSRVGRCFRGRKDQHGLLMPHHLQSLLLLLLLCICGCLYQQCCNAVLYRGIHIGQAQVFGFLNGALLLEVGPLKKRAKSARCKNNRRAVRSLYNVKTIIINNNTKKIISYLPSLNRTTVDPPNPNPTLAHLTAWAIKLKHWNSYKSTFPKKPKKIKLRASAFSPLCDKY